jgi:hypothetical protein
MSVCLKFEPTQADRQAGMQWFKFPLGNFGQIEKYDFGLYNLDFSIAKFLCPKFVRFLQKSKNPSRQIFK